MSKAKNSSLSTPLSVLATVSGRLDGLSESDFVAPTKKAETGVILVGSMPDHLRRLATLRSLLTDEHNGLVREVETLQSKIDAATQYGGGGLRGLVHMLRGGLSAETPEALERKVTELTLKRLEYEVVNQLFWLEMRVAFAELADKPKIGVYAGWQAGYNPQKETDEEHIKQFLREHVFPDLLDKMLQGGPKDSRHIIVGGRSSTDRRERVN